MIHEENHCVKTIFDILRTKMGIALIFLSDQAAQESHVNLTK